MFVTRFHTTKPANAAWAANVRASLARLWVIFWSCRRTTHRFRWPFCTVRATCCHRVVFSSNNSRYRAGTFDSCLLVIYFFEKKNVEQMKKTISRSFSPKKNPIKKSMEVEEYSKTIFYRKFFLSGICEEFGRILAVFLEGFCEFFAGGTIFQGAKIISNFWKYIFTVKGYSQVLLYLCLLTLRG